MKLGVQLYGAMREFRADPDAFCARLAAAGYTELEPCVSLNLTPEQLEKNGMSPVWMPEEVPVFKEIMKKYGLGMTTSHIFADVRKDADKAVALAKDNDIQYIVVNCQGGKEAAGYEAFAEGCIELAEKLKTVGTELWMHNGWPEVRTQFDGVTGLEIALKHCGGAVGAQVDTGWVLYGGMDPVVLMERMKPYIRSVHHKGICEGYAEKPLGEIHIAMGKGAVDWKAAHAFAVENGLPEVIDQDMSPDDFVQDLVDTAELLLNA